MNSEALAIGLDYFVPSRKGQFSIFIDVLKQTTSDEAKTSSLSLLDQLLDYFSNVGTLYRLLMVILASYRSAHNLGLTFSPPNFLVLRARQKTQKKTS